MALISSNYRLHVDITYTTTANATTALANINSALAADGRSEVAVQNNLQVTLLIPSLTEAEAIKLRDDIKSAWSATARTGGKAAVSRSNATT